MELPQPQDPTKRLTPQQSKLLEGLLKGMNVTAAAKAAGYAPATAGQAGYNALKAIRRKVPKIMKKHGLDEDALIQKYLKPGLDAMETEFGKFKGMIVDREDVIAWGPRLQALDMAFRIHGSYAADDKDAATDGLKIVIDVDVVNSARTTG